MKLFLIFFLFLNITSIPDNKEGENSTLKIIVSVTKYNKGNILLALYNSKNNYMKKAYKSSRIKVKDNKAIIIFNHLKKGTYAFTLFHDLNENNKLDTNFLGIPKEPYGFSNEERGRFGPPSFDKVTFIINSDTSIKVKIN